MPDTIAPVSRVAALPPTSPAQIPLSWTGSDDALGSGIAGFDLFVSTDNGPFVRWLQNTRNTSAIYPGAAGRRYAFYAIARDVAGNVESAPLAPEATTLTTGNSAPQILSAPSVSVDEGQTVEVTVEATDADLPGDTLTYSLVAAPGSPDRAHQRGVELADRGERRSQDAFHHRAGDRQRGPGAERRPDPAGDGAGSEPTGKPGNPGGHSPALEGQLWTLGLGATDPDLPKQALRYRLTGSVPAGLTINTVSGQLTWVPGRRWEGAVSGLT
ncbi:MAG: hypothetical protein H7A46_08510 [Verrucomicrobiales bacterium]|nr:hypothetical protein [Verrucomicrobiales bacterium]